MLRAHGPIGNNDDWAAEGSKYVADVMAKCMLGQPLKLIEQRLIDNIRAHIGIMPESPKRYMERLSVTELARKVDSDAPQVS